MNNGLLMQFTGEGRGFMNGVTEYLVYTTDTAADPEEYACPGFTVDNTTAVELPDWMPQDQILKVTL